MIGTGRRWRSLYRAAGAGGVPAGEGAEGFAKVFLKAGESRRVCIPFDDKTFRYWNVKTDRWEIEGGNYQIVVAASAADLRLVGRLEVKGTTEIRPYDRDQMPSYFSGMV